MWIADLDELSDDDLVRRFVSGGSPEAVNVLLGRHQDRVFGLAFRILGNRADALDATQDVFIGVFRKAGSFKHQSAFSTWLYRLTVNACTDLARKRARQPVPGEALEVPQPDGAGRSDDRLVIEDALRRIPVDQRTAVVMRDLYRMTYEEIAEATGAAVGTVKSRISRGRDLLAHHLAPGDEGESSPGEQFREHGREHAGEHGRGPGRLSRKRP